MDLDDIGSDPSSYLGVVLAVFKGSQKVLGSAFVCKRSNLILEVIIISIS